MASVFISRVKPGNLVLTVLILMVTRHTHSTTSITSTESTSETTEYMTLTSDRNRESSTKKTESTPTPISNKDNLTFESSCAALDWSEAETDCIKKGASIFTIQDLSEAIGGRVLEKAKAEHGTIWIMGNGTICQTAFNVSFDPANCSDINYYVCKTNTSGSSEWYVPCQGGSTVTVTSTQGTGSTAHNFQMTTPGSNRTVTVIAAATGVIAVLVVVFITTGFYIIRRNKKPIKYAVRAESAMYHKQHPDPGQAESPQLADAQPVSSTEADIGNGRIGVRRDGEYDTLCGVMGSKWKADTSDTTAVYSHLRGNNAAGDSKEDNPYDTTTLQQYDRKPVDKIYDRLHVPEQ